MCRLKSIGSFHLSHAHKSWWHFEIFVRLRSIIPLDFLLEDASSFFFSVILDHFVLVTLLHLEFKNELSGIFDGLGLDDVVIIAVRAMLVSLFEVLVDVLSESLLAFFAQEHHLCRSLKFVVLCLLVAQWAVEPFLAARSANSNLSV